MLVAYRFNYQSTLQCHVVTVVLLLYSSMQPVTHDISSVAAVTAICYQLIIFEWTLLLTSAMATMSREDLTKLRMFLMLIILAFAESSASPLSASKEEPRTRDELSVIGDDLEQLDQLRPNVRLLAEVILDYQSIGLLENHNIMRLKPMTDARETRTRNSHQKLARETCTK